MLGCADLKMLHKLIQGKVYSMQLNYSKQQKALIPHCTSTAYSTGLCIVVYEVELKFL